MGNTLVKKPKYKKPTTYIEFLKQPKQHPLLQLDKAYIQEGIRKMRTHNPAPVGLCKRVYSKGYKHTFFNPTLK